MRALAAALLSLQYRSPNELVPRKKDRHVVIFWDNSGELGAWKTKCFVARETLAPNREALQYFEDRFWVWCLYADSKFGAVNSGKHET